MILHSSWTSLVLTSTASTGPTRQRGRSLTTYGEFSERQAQREPEEDQRSHETAVARSLEASQAKEIIRYRDYPVWLTAGLTSGMESER